MMVAASNSGNGVEAPASPEIRVVEDLWAITPENRERVVAFWKSEGAFQDPAQADARLREVIAHAVNADGEVIAVCTAVACNPPRLAQPMYYYRCFVGKTWRSSRLVLRLLREATRMLETYARSNDFPCIGILLELENDRFKETLQRPHWPSTGFTYIGKSPRGLDVRVRYFRGAALKPSASS